MRYAWFGLACLVVAAGLFFALFQRQVVCPGQYRIGSAEERRAEGLGYCKKEWKLR